MPPLTLVLGATGNVGRPLADLLASRGVPVRAATRSPEAYAPPRPGVEAVAFDYDDPSTFAPALAGVEHAFIHPKPTDLRPDRSLLPLLAEAERAGVRRIVLLTVMGIENVDDAALHRVEQAYAASPIPVTILRPNWFMQNFTSGFLRGMIDKAGTFFLPAGDAASSLVDARDVAAVAAAALTTDGHEGRTYTLTGPAAITYREAASVLSEASGRKITYVPLPEIAMKTAMRGMGWDAESVKAVAALFRAVRAGESAPVSPDVANVLGRAPHTFEAFAREHADAFRAAP